MVTAAALCIFTAVHDHNGVYYIAVIPSQQVKFVFIWHIFSTASIELFGWCIAADLSGFFNMINSFAVSLKGCNFVCVFSLFNTN